MDYKYEFGAVDVPRADFLAALMAAGGSSTKEGKGGVRRTCSPSCYSAPRELLRMQRLTLDSKRCLCLQHDRDGPSQPLALSVDALLATGELERDATTALRVGKAEGGAGGDGVGGGAGDGGGRVQATRNLGVLVNARAVINLV